MQHRQDLLTAYRPQRAHHVGRVLVEQGLVEDGRNGRRAASDDPRVEQVGRDVDFPAVAVVERRSEVSAPEWATTSEQDVMRVTLIEHRHRIAALPHVCDEIAAMDEIAAIQTSVPRRSFPNGEQHRLEPLVLDKIADGARRDLQRHRCLFRG